eukprot:3929849-Rhodomonas_salina.1
MRSGKAAADDFAQEITGLQTDNRLPQPDPTARVGAMDRTPGGGFAGDDTRRLTKDFNRAPTDRRMLDMDDGGFNALLKYIDKNALSSPSPAAKSRQRRQVKPEAFKNKEPSFQGFDHNDNGFQRDSFKCTNGKFEALPEEFGTGKSSSKSNSVASSRAEPQRRADFVENDTMRQLGGKIGEARPKARKDEAAGVQRGVDIMRDP